MANLTLRIDAYLLKRARIRALEADTSVNALVRAYLENFATANSGRRAIDGFLDVAEDSTASSGVEGRSWSREDLYTERLRREDSDRR